MSEREVFAILEAKCPRTRDARRASLASWRRYLGRLAGRLGEKGSVLLLASNGYHDGELVPWGYQLSRLAGQAGLPGKNVYVRYFHPRPLPGKPLNLSHELVFYHVKSLRDYQFNKSVTLEPHVFKELEWGGRAMGRSGYHEATRTSRRYPDGGRDPGNVLYDANRAPDGSVLKLKANPRERVISRLARAVSEPDWTLVTNISDSRALVALKQIGYSIEQVTR